MKIYDGKDVPDESLDNIKPIRYPLTKGGRIVMISTNKEYNETVHFRPNDDDARIMTRIRDLLADLIGIETTNRAETAVIRHALRFWDKNNREEE